MLTLKQIINNTARFGPDRFDYAAGSVRTSSFKFGIVKSEKLIRAICKTWSERIDGSWKQTQYATVIDFVSPKGYVTVSCSCPDFCFRFEYALAKKGASAIRYCNGESPGVRNPSLIAGCCKHIVKLTDLLLDKKKIDREFLLR